MEPLMPLSDFSAIGQAGPVQLRLCSRSCRLRLAATSPLSNAQADFWTQQWKEEECVARIMASAATGWNAAPLALAQAAQFGSVGRAPCTAWTLQVARFYGRALTFCVPN